MTVELAEFTGWRRSVDARLAKLEAASDQHAVQASEQKGHLVSMDKDLSEIQVQFRAQRGMLQALHDTQTEHTAMLRDHTTRLTRLETGLGEVKVGLATVNVGVQTIIGLLKSADGDGESGDSSQN